MKAWSLAAIPILCAAFAAAQSRPGHTGNIPDPAPPHSIDGKTVGPPPAPMFCELPEQEMVTARARVESCKSADYAKLYDAALADSTRLDAWMSCPEECGPARRFMVAQEWNCYEDEAQVDLTWVLICSKKKFVGREMDRPSADAFKEPMRYARQRQRSWWPIPYSARLINTTDDPLDCPSNRFVGFTYEEVTHSCQTAVYTDSIKRADIEAHRWYDSLKCPEGCEKSPWELVYKEWKCEEAKGEWLRPTIKIEYLLSMTCRK
jgi:hypothetical protein